MHIIFSSFLMFLSLFGWGQFEGNQLNANHTTRQVYQSAASSPTPKPSASRVPFVTPTPSPSASPVAAAAEIASEAVCPAQSNISNTVATLTCLSNQARAFNHVGSISAQPALLAAAAAKAADMKSCGYGHEACGHAFEYEILAQGYSGKCYGENIAYGQKSPHDVFVAWMNSPGHRANILNPDYHDLGVAETDGPNGPLWVMELGGC